MPLAGFGSHVLSFLHIAPFEHKQPRQTDGKHQREVAEDRRERPSGRGNEPGDGDRGQHKRECPTENQSQLAFAAILAAYEGFARKLAPFVTNISVELSRSIAGGAQVLFEGAQGTHLDIDHGTYPFVTSSNTVAGNACGGAGVGPRVLTGVLGIAKAYTTRVGEGPFPTELLDETGDQLQQRGAEFGATTGRKRRCGWLDTVIVRNAARLNSLSGLAITKLDVLGGQEQIKICNAYRHNGRVLDEFPTSLKILAECDPIYETLPGWSEDIRGVRRFDDLPPNARDYLKRIEALTGVSIEILSVGPGREETVILENPFAR